LLILSSYAHLSYAWSKYPVTISSPVNICIIHVSCAHEIISTGTWSAVSPAIAAFCSGTCDISGITSGIIPVIISSATVPVIISSSPENIFHVSLLHV